MTVKCTRCDQEGESLAKPPYPGQLGDEIAKSTCSRCFEEWKKMSVKVINEYKLRPFLPQDRQVLEQHMREFLQLEGMATLSK